MVIVPPLSVPPLQVKGPVTVKAAKPVSVPAIIVRAGMVSDCAPGSLSVPAPPDIVMPAPRSVMVPVRSAVPAESTTVPPPAP